MLVVAVVAFAFYAPSLRFGFFNDDPTGHFRWMEGRSVWSLLTDAGGHGYYRPVSFILWQVLHTLLGRHDPFALHLLNVLAHAANAALVVWLAHRLTGRLTYATLAGALFALYPFSYEAVPYVGSFVHPLVTLLILLTLAFYIRWREDGARWAFVATHVSLALAVFTQENAVITPLLLIFLGLVRSADFSRSWDEQLKSSLPTLSFFAEPAIFAIAWLLVPKTAEARTLSLEAMRANVLPFAQALVYPVAPLANHNPTALALLAAISLVVLFAVARYARVTRLFAFGLIVWALASLPSILVLDNAYVLGSPRLYYLPSVGAALVWSIPILAFRGQRSEADWPTDLMIHRRGAENAEKTYKNLCELGVSAVNSTGKVKSVSQPGSGVRSRIAEWGICAVIFAACYVPSAGYMRCELAYQGMAGEIGRMMAGATRSAPPGQEVTFVNLPYFFSSRGKGTECRNPFVFAPTGAVVIPSYADAHDFAFYNGGPDISTSAVTVRDAERQPGWQTFGEVASVEQLRQRLSASRVFVFDLIRWQLFDLSTAWQPNARKCPARATLSGVQICNLQSTLSNSLVVTLTWQSVTAVQDRKVFVHLYNSSGKVAAQDDSMPAQGFVPTSWWRPGDIITDTHIIPLASLPPGTYRVTAGMYDAIAGTRIEARGEDGARLPDDELWITNITR
jgi:hypothetical protein